MRKFLTTLGLIGLFSALIFGLVIVLWPPEVTAASLRFLWAGLFAHWPLLLAAAVVLAAGALLVWWWRNRRRWISPPRSPRQAQKGRTMELDNRADRGKIVIGSGRPTDAESESRLCAALAFYLRSLRW